jgi:hypothetical protein
MATGWRATKSAMVARAMATTKRDAGERRRRRRRGRWRWQRGRRVTKRAMVRVGRVMATPTKRAMAMATRAAGNKEGDGEGGESDGNGDKEGGEEEGKGPHSSSSSDRLPSLSHCSPSSSDSRPPSAPSWAPPCVIPSASLPPPPPPPPRLGSTFRHQTVR